MNIVVSKKDGLNTLEKRAVQAKIKDAPEEVCIILIDTSGSMTGFHEGEIKLNVVKQTVPELLKTKHIVLYGLAQFNSDASIVCQPTPSKGTVFTTIQGLSAAGGTQMDDGINLSINMLNTIDASHKRIILLSDGHPTCSHNQLVSVVKRCSGQGIKIDTIAFGDDAAEELLKWIAEVTNGVYQKANTRQQLTSVYKSLRFEERYLEHKTPIRVDRS